MNAHRNARTTPFGDTLVQAADRGSRRRWTNPLHIATGGGALRRGAIQKHHARADCRMTSSSLRTLSADGFQPANRIL